MSEFIVSVGNQSVFTHTDQDIAEVEFDLRTRLSASPSSRSYGNKVLLTKGKSILRQYPEPPRDTMPSA